MATNLLGIPNSNVIVPYSAATKRTKQLDINANVTISSGSVSAKACHAIFFSDSSGNWWMTFQGYIDLSSDTNLSGSGTSYISIATGANFVGGTSVAFEALSSAEALQLASAQCNSSTNRIVIYTASTTIRYMRFSGTVALASEPTTYTIAANMEGALPVDVYIPNATNSAGLLNYYEEGTFTGYVTDGSNVSSAITFRYVRTGKLVTISQASGSMTVTSAGTSRWLSNSSTPATKTWPSSLLPTASQYIPLIIRDGTTYTWGQGVLASTGVFALYVDATGNVFSSNNVAKGIEPITFSYHVG